MGGPPNIDSSTLNPSRWRSLYVDSAGSKGVGEELTASTKPTLHLPGRFGGFRVIGSRGFIGCLGFMEFRRFLGYKV